ncbi:MAG: hypothetical protein HYU66_20260 [Armatimonadetes bacterium]|nr:hypothetical protein [Armatimonadota bacterium]
MEPWVDSPRMLRALRWVLVALAVADVALGVHAVVRPYAVGPYASPVLTDRFYVRIIGVFWLFMAYVETLGWRDPKRNLLAVQLAFMLRLPTGLLNLAEYVLCPPWAGSRHGGHGLFAALDLAIWLIGVGCLRRLGQKWWAW